MRLDKIKIDSKVLIIIVIIILGVAGYFVYTEFFKNTAPIVNSASDGYVSATKLGRLVDTINKQNISFDTNINNDVLDNAQDFSIEILPSSNVGRSNPFLP